MYSNKKKGDKMEYIIRIFADISLSLGVLSSFTCFLITYIYYEKKESIEFYLAITLVCSALSALTVYNVLNSFVWTIIPDAIVLLYHVLIAVSASSYIKVIETKFKVNDYVLKASKMIYDLILFVLILSLISEVMIGSNPILNGEVFYSKSVIMNFFKIESSPTILGEILAISFLIAILFSSVRIIQINNSRESRNHLMTFGVLLSLIVLGNNTLTAFPDLQYCVPLGFASFLFESIRMSIGIQKASYLDNKRMQNDISHLSQTSILGLATRQTLHELKNPIFTARMASERIDKKQSCEITKALLRSVTDMENIVEDILLASIRPNNTKKTAENITEVINEAIKSIAARIDKNNIQLIVSSKISNTNIKIHKHRIPTLPNDHNSKH